VVPGDCFWQIVSTAKNDGLGGSTTIKGKGQPLGVLPLTWSLGVFDVFLKQGGSRSKSRTKAV